MKLQNKYFIDVRVIFDGLILYSYYMKPELLKLKFQCSLPGLILIWSGACSQGCDFKFTIDRDPIQNQIHIFETQVDLAGRIVRHFLQNQSQLFVIKIYFFNMRTIFNFDILFFDWILLWTWNHYGQYLGWEWVLAYLPKIINKCIKKIFPLINHSK